MDRYLEVVGEGKFTETASRFVAEVNLGVHAVKQESALSEIAALHRETVQLLRGAGLTDDEIVDGGAGFVTSFDRPWTWKKKHERDAKQRLIIKVKQLDRLYAALGVLENLQSRVARSQTVYVELRQPEFEAPSEMRAVAHSSAFLDAQEKAQQLAARTNGKLGKVLFVEEAGRAKRNSGFSGDEDWFGDSSRFEGRGLHAFSIDALEAVPRPSEQLAMPTRTIFVQCRVRFELLDA
jgi:uncharacterized protein YggE